MANSEAIESIQATLQPLEELQGEQTQLESWVHDSFSALEKLHEELTEWQTELARKQTELDLREDTLEKSLEQDGVLDTSVVHLRKELEEAREEIQQLEEENTEQLQEFENLEQSHNVLESELKVTKQHSEDLSVALESERTRANHEQNHWAGEFQEIRQQLERQCLLLEEHLSDDKLLVAPIENETALPAVESDVSSRSAELRKRAQARLAAKRRRQRNSEEPDKG